MRIGILGGTGPQGRGLASRFARAGHDVQIGSRGLARAAATADSLNAGARTNRGWDSFVPTRGQDNAGAVAGSEVVIVSVPFSAQRPLLTGLADHLTGKIVVTCVNPIAFDEVGPYPVTVPEGSAAQQAATILPRSRVVAAFHHLAAANLADTGPVHDESVLVCGDDDASRSLVIELSNAVAGRGGVNAGPLRNARQLESLTAVLISINRAHRVRAGISISGL